MSIDWTHYEAVAKSLISSGVSDATKLISFTSAILPLLEVVSPSTGATVTEVEAIATAVTAALKAISSIN